MGRGPGERRRGQREGEGVKIGRELKTKSGAGMAKRVIWKDRER